MSLIKMPSDVSLSRSCRISSSPCSRCLPAAEISVFLYLLPKRVSMAFRSIPSDVRRAVVMMSLNVVVEFFTLHRNDAVINFLDV